MQYELVREIFNLCPGNQMRDVFINEIQTDDLDGYMKQYLVGDDVRCNKSTNENGVVVFDVTIDNLNQRFAFTPE